MYVALPKNYGGTAFSKESRIPTEQPRMSIPQTLPYPSTRMSEEPMPPKKPCDDRKDECKEQCREECRNECNDERKDECKNENKNPLSCLLSALRHGKSGGIDAEDFLILGLIALLISKGGNEDIVLILVMLLLL